MARRVTARGKASRKLIMQHIKAYRAEHGYSPTYRQLQALTGISYSTICYHVERLIRDGKFERTTAGVRNYRLAGESDMSDFDVEAVSQEIMEAKGLSRTDHVYEYIARVWHWLRRAPSIREIQAALDFSSTSIVNYHVRKLIAEGRVERSYGHGTLVPTDR